MNSENTKYHIRRLDINVAYACNIKCKGCISLSDFDRTGVVSAADVDSWLAYWSPWLDIDVLTLFGGEPLLNPELDSICKIVRKYYPTSTLRLITNGYLLKNFDSQSWFSLQPFELQVSVHRLDHEDVINKQIAKIMKPHSGWKTTKNNLNQHQQILFELPGFKIYKSKFKDFVAPYRLINQKLLPFDSDPIQAHKICGSPNTPILYKGKLYKCPPVANIIDVTKHNWNNYEACSSTEQLEHFVSAIGKAEAVCGQCPDNFSQHTYNHFDPANVYVKQKITG